MSRGTYFNAWVSLRIAQVTDFTSLRIAHVRIAGASEVAFEDDLWFKIQVWIIVARTGCAALMQAAYE